MLPDQLFNDIPKRITVEAQQLLQPGERLIVCTTAKNGFRWVPTYLLAKSTFLALTDRRLLVFFPNRMGSAPKRLAFSLQLESINVRNPNHTLEVITPEKGFAVLRLSKVFSAQSDELYTYLDSR